VQDGYDVEIVGADAIGASIAYFLAADPDFDGSILLVDRDPSFARAATSLSAAALRMQFSNAINVQMARFSHDCMMRFTETMQVAGEAPRLNFHPRGDLFLAQTADQATTLRANHAVQIANGADVVLLNPVEVETAFPYLRSDDLAVASYGRADEGGDNTALMAGLSLPVETRKRTLFVFDCAHSPEGSATVDGGRLPLLVEPNGVYCRPEGRYFLVGCSPAEDPEVAHDDFDPRYDEFEEIIWPTLADPGRTLRGFRGDQGDQPMGRPLRSQPAGSQPDPRRPSRAGEFLYRHRLSRPRADAGAGGRAGLGRPGGPRPL